MDTATTTIAPDTAAPKATTTQTASKRYYLGRSNSVWLSGLSVGSVELKLGA